MHAALRLPDGRLLGAPPQADRNRSARLLVAPEVAARRYRFPFQVLDDDLLEHRRRRRINPGDRLPVLGLGQFPSSAIKDEIVGNADAEHTARRRRGGLFRVDPPFADSWTSATHRIWKVWPTAGPRQFGLPPGQLGRRCPGRLKWTPVRRPAFGMVLDQAKPDVAPLDRLGGDVRWLSGGRDVGRDCPCQHHAVTEQALHVFGIVRWGSAVS